VHLQPLGEYDYTATDLRPEMIAMAREKAEAESIPLRFAVEDFSDYRVDALHDVVILLYDGLNYLLEEDKVASLFRCTFEALKPGGIFFFDQSTPANSINNEAYFSDEGEIDGFNYVRGSEYDRDTRLHTTTFEITIEGQTYVERHVQRAYLVAPIRTLLEEAGFTVLEAFDGFSARPARETSERIHWVVRKPE
jgi:SAM-dependent methyltransferase